MTTPALMALETADDDLYAVAERSGNYRQAFLVAMELLVDRERRLTVAREHFARLRDENLRLRMALMGDGRRAA